MGASGIAAIAFALSSLPAFGIARLLRREPGAAGGRAARDPGKAALDRRLAALMEAVGAVGLAAAAGLWWAGDDRGRATLVIVATIVLVNALVVAVLASVLRARGRR
jgi:hypothetical protein